MTACVYFLQAGAGGLIKIGTTTDLRERVRALQTGSSEVLDVLATVPGDEAIEKRLHAQFSRLRRKGEWFVPHPELLALIQGARLHAARPAPGLPVRVEKTVRRAAVGEALTGSRAALAAIEAAADAVPKRRARR